MKLLKLFGRSTHGVLWYLILVVLLPVGSLSVLGLLHLWENGQLILALTIWLAVTLFGYALLFAWPERTGRSTASSTADKAGIDANENNSLPDQLAEGRDWTQHDQLIWQTNCTQIDAIIAAKPSWDALLPEALGVLSSVSAAYNETGKKRSASVSEAKYLEYRFTLPEALLVLSIASKRYRTLVLAHIPFVDKVTLDKLFSLYGRQQTIKTGFTWLNNARRVLRLSNPAAAALGELRDQFTNRVFTQLSENVQNDLKRLLLQEVAQVGIDLYSGRLKSSDEELAHYQSQGHRDDLLRVPQAREPLRIVFLGQTSAGKSSLINALTLTLSAEVDTLPSTQDATTYRLDLPDSMPLHLIDTQGIEHDASNQQVAVKHALEADLVILVVRASQPGRAPDQMLIRAMRTELDARPARRPPPILLVMTHVDQLSPRNSWAPPYDLNGDDPKAVNMTLAMRSALQQIELPEDTLAIPVCLSDQKEQYNVEALAAQLMALQQSAALAQMNRRRLEHDTQTVSWQDRWSQIRRLGLVMGRAVVGTRRDGTE